MQEKLRNARQSKTSIISGQLQHPRKEGIPIIGGISINAEAIRHHLSLENPPSLSCIHRNLVVPEKLTHLMD